jgi:threonine/homoserine/homoserine lactone efflux protein
VIAFLGIAVLVIVAPGPDFALTMRNTVRGRGPATALGVASGQLVWVVATAGGVAAVLAASHPAFVALRLGGAAYLVWLGLTTLRSGGGAHALRLRRVSPYRQGLLSNLANPKMPVFFISLLPQFGTSFLALAVHGLVFAALTLSWLLLVSRGASLLLVPRVRRVVDIVTGVALTAFGVQLATERR